MDILYLGIDLAKNVFAVHVVNAAGKPELVPPKVARAKLHEFVARLPPCTIGMEACSGAHHWARLFTQHGHTVRLIAPKFVTSTASGFQTLNIPGSIASRSTPAGYRLQTEGSPCSLS